MNSNYNFIEAIKRAMILMQQEGVTAIGLRYRGHV